MAREAGRAGRPSALIDRHSERAALDRLLGAVRAGQSQVLVVRGDPGVGKTVLLDYLAGLAADCRVMRVMGVQPEMELAFAGLHQLCAPLLGWLPRLPAHQRAALRTALGLSAGPPPDRFLVGLAVLSLLAETAGSQPLICLIDDEQWLDRASAQALGFAGRRLAADPVGLVFAARVPGPELAGLPELAVPGLGEDDARALLESVLAGPLDTRVRDLILAETNGNPLALLELPRGLSPAELAGGFGLPGAVPVTGRIEDSFERQLAALPEQTRRLVLLAAADPSGDPSLVWRAAGRLDIPVQAATPAVAAGLAEFGPRIRFRQPLIRSVAYRSASLPGRQEAHAALAVVTDPQQDPDRRAWHRAQAAAGPDEEVAAELERSAGRAQARGGLAAAAAFLERSVALTVDPARRVQRTLSAAQASLQAGAFGKTRELLAIAEAGPADEFASARADLLRGQAIFAAGLGSDAPPMLLKAAKRLEPHSVDLARETYLRAWIAAMFAGCLAGAGDLAEVSRAALALSPSADPPRLADLLLDGLARLVAEDEAGAAPALRQAASAFASEGLSADDGLRWGWLAQVAAIVLWDEDRWHAIAVRQTQLARAAGSLDQLAIDLAAEAVTVIRSGDFPAAIALIAEADVVAEATGVRYPPFAALWLACLSGDEAEAAPLIEATVAEGAAGGQGHAVSFAHLVAAMLYNGLGRYADALSAAELASRDPLYIAMWALPELIEAAVRSGESATAAEATERLAGIVRMGGTSYGRGVEARSRALLSDGAVADGLYREAIDRLSRTRLRPELARAHLLYGEWLRRENRRVDARTHLRAAYQMLATMGAGAFAERARRELLAAGVTLPRRAPEARTVLTAQEATIARLARDGQTNTEIGTQLFLSARTVEWHLGNVFTKLGITSRRELRRALASLGHASSGGGLTGSPVVAVHDLAERAAVRVADQRQRPVSRVAEINQVRAEPVRGEAEHAARQVLVLDARLAAANAQAGRRQHDAHRRLAEVVLEAVPLPLVRRLRGDQRNRRRRVGHMTSPPPHVRQLQELLALADQDEIPGLPVLRGRRPAAGLEDLVKVIVGDRPVLERPHVPPRPDRLPRLHSGSLGASAAGGHHWVSLQVR
jgi:DNA-binding CsgD family transcriptional regulator